MRRTVKRLLLAVVFALPALAVTVADVNMENSVAVGGQTLVLNGAGVRKKFFIKVYVGGLYLPAKQGNPAAILSSDGPRRQVMHFLYGVSKNQMCEAWEEGLEDNTKNAGGDVKAAFKTLCGWMEAIPKGNRLILTYVPGTGTTVEINGKVKGVLPGKATADAILNTWIGPKPGPGEDFKNAVLGK